MTTDIVDRRTYLGGPAAASVVGVNPYRTAVNLWQFLTGRQQQDDPSEAMQAGLLLEGAVLDYAERQLGKLERGVFLRDRELPYLAGHLDALTAEGDVVEAKTSRSRDGWGEPGSNQIPFAYHVQALHYMGLSGARQCWVPVLFGGLTFAMYLVPRDDDLIRQLRAACVVWWTKYIETDCPPPPETAEDIALLFPRSTERGVQAGDATYEAYRHLLDVRERQKVLDAEREALEGTLKAAMLDAGALLRGDQTLATWRTTTSKRFDTTAFKAAHADLYAEFSQPVESRRFLLKDMKP